MPLPRVLLIILTACTFVGCSTDAAQQVRAVPPARPRAHATPLEKLIAAGIEQTTYTKTYDPAYVKLAYPGGDVPRETGVCADVVVRAFRACGLDLQKEVHEDMAANFGEYPKTWGAKKTDANIDHRRVGNLMKWFERQGKSLPLTKDPQDYRPGDIVAWELDGRLLHTGLVTDLKAVDFLGRENGHYQIVHNIGVGARIEDRLFEWKVIGHYRYFNGNAKAVEELKIGTIQKPDWRGECGYRLQSPTDYRRNAERFLFLADFSGQTLMNLDGQDLRLKFVAESNSKKELTVGQRSWSLYSAGETKVRVDYVVRGVCDPKDEGCEMTRYSAMITVTRNGLKQAVKTLGSGGC